MLASIRRSAIAVALALCMLPAAALAQDAEPDFVREGFWMSADLSYTILDCETCPGNEHGLGTSWTFGGTINQQWLLGIGTANWFRVGGDRNMDGYAALLKARYYPHDNTQFFLSGGAGVGRYKEGGPGADPWEAPALALKGLLGMGEYGSDVGGAGTIGVGFDMRVDEAAFTPFGRTSIVLVEGQERWFHEVGASLTIH